MCSASSRAERRAGGIALVRLLRIVRYNGGCKRLFENAAVLIRGLADALLPLPPASESVRNANARATMPPINNHDFDIAGRGY